MNKHRIFITATFIAFSAIACSKKNDNNNVITVQNLSGTYALQGLVWKVGTESVNVYEALDDCQKDNLVRLNEDMTAGQIDAGQMCSPPENATGTWRLSGDSIYLSSSSMGGKITSFDGTTLVITGAVENQPSVTGTTTLKKQ